MGRQGRDRKTDRWKRRHACRAGEKEEDMKDRDRDGKKRQKAEKAGRHLKRRRRKEDLCQ